MPKTTVEHYKYKTVVTPLERGDGSGPPDWERDWQRMQNQKLPEDCNGLHYSHSRWPDDGVKEFTYFESEQERDKYARSHP